MEKDIDPESTPELSIEECIAVVRTKLDQLEIIDNSYFKKDRDVKMRELYDNIISLLDQKMFDVNNASKKVQAGTKNSINSKVKSEYYYLKGKTLDFIPEFQKEAEENLAKAVKLKPCWNEPMRALAHVYWKKGDYEKSVLLYNNAIEEEPNDKRALRELSMVIRRLPSAAPKDKAKILADSIDYAKKAVSIDFKDSESWYVLGNAHLTNFFMGGQNYEHLDFALKAYTQSEKLQVYQNPDLYFNRGTIYNYLERYSESINDLEKSHSIDPNLGARNKAKAISEFVASV